MTTKPASIELGRRTRRHFSNKQIQEYLGCQAGSGKTIRAFCLDQGLTPSVFYRWQRIHGSRPPKPDPVFREVSMPSILGSEWAAEITLRSGTMVKVRPGCEVRWFAELLHHLKK